MKILICGAKGQLGSELMQTAPAHHLLLGIDRDQLDIRDVEAVARVVDDFRPEAVINAAAYSAVDHAETNRQIAFAVNAEGPAHLARAAARTKARMLQVSTDYVFDGTRGVPYLPSDTPAPLNVYGASKLAGDQAVFDHAGEHAIVVRTAWLFSTHGSNFVKTMLRLMQTREHLDVVHDQIGTPTWARELAITLWQIVERPDLGGILHWTHAGVASWYDFAVAIAEEGTSLGLLDRIPAVAPISARNHGSIAPRPAFSVLDKDETWDRLQSRPQHWRAALRDMLRELSDA